tara:strand:+ start:315 stop:704 length:390 start_codon:yes stop_codon:yes gene_type:complete
MAFFKRALSKAKAGAKVTAKKAKAGGVKAKAGAKVTARKAKAGAKTSKVRYKAGKKRTLSTMRTSARKARTARVMGKRKVTQKKQAGKRMKRAVQTEVGDYKKESQLAWDDFMGKKPKKTTRRKTKKRG